MELRIKTSNVTGKRGVLYRNTISIGLLHENIEKIKSVF